MGTSPSQENTISIFSGPWRWRWQFSHKVSTYLLIWPPLYFGRKQTSKLTPCQIKFHDTIKIVC